ncbi:MAG: hypothetical protein NZ870_02025, partial [bacterium]|nr:hypothetical protein [bacterium]
SKPCAGKITKNQYERIVNAIKNLITGKTKKLEEYLIQEIKKSAKNLEFEKAEKLKRYLEKLNIFKTDFKVYETSEDEILKWVLDPILYENLKKELNLKKMPYHIEAFDVSHFSGKHVVGSNVCFRFFKKFTPHYRRYIIKKQVNDDYSAIYEIVYRRMKKIEKPPDLILVDGGLGQLNKAIEAIKKLKKTCDVIAIAKPLDKIITKDGAIEVSNETKLKLMEIRDEVHRFSIKFHRKKSRNLYLVN